MARRTTMDLIDDIDEQSLAAETVCFALDGVNYEIDLTEENAAKLRADLQEWIEAGRRITPRRATRAPKSSGGIDPAAVRAWAKSAGVQVGRRGRIPAAVIAQYMRERPEPVQKPQVA